jgi:hypothetical protein
VYFTHWIFAQLAPPDKFKVVSLHHDISTVTGEEIVFFTLAESPNVRESKKK